jgi:hypothetical protein
MADLERENIMIRAVILALLPTGALACAMEEPFHPSDLAHAQVVVAATVRAYHQEPTYEGVLTVAVREVLKGEVPGILTLTWSPDLSEWPPATWDRPVDVILSAIPPQDGRGWQLSVQACGSAWLLADTAENRAIVTAEIARLGVGQ